VEHSEQTLQINAPMEIVRTESLNVLAKLEGRDKSARDEHLMLGAHLDHLGQRDGNVYYGADDNASGTTAVLMAARALATNAQKPRRSVLLALWTGEESGLLGSSYFVKHPVVPLPKIVAYLNLDMVGRDGNLPEFSGQNAAQSTLSAQALSVAGRSSSTDFTALLREQNRYVNFEIKESSDFFLKSSDTGPFVDSRIPTAFFFSGLHSDYHRPSDTPDKINFAKVTNAAKWAYLSIWQAAERATRVMLNKSEPKPVTAQGAP
jgi:Zn-dependent M28 family amino/carboxypeptidase